MKKFILVLMLLIETIMGICQAKVSAKPDLFYIAIGSCVYGQREESSSPLFPERLNIKDLREGFNKDYQAYNNDPVVTRRKDSLSKTLHGVDWSQLEIAHDFAVNSQTTDTFPGDVYINRVQGPWRGKKLTIQGTDTTESWEPPFLFDTLTQDIGSFFDSTDFDGAKKSAVAIGQLLDQKGAKGITIASYDQPVSRNMFFAAIDSLWKLIQRAHKPNPVIVFYYCGHGYADGFGRRFLVPGTFTGALNKMPIDIRRLRSVFVKDLYNYLGLAGYPFILLLDCCSGNEGNPPKDDINTYFEKMALNADGPALMKAVYETFFQPKGDAVVLYSSRLGSNSQPVPDPTNSRSFTYIGPICRRILLANKKDKGLFYSFDKLQVLLTNKSLDRMTKVPGIYCKDCTTQLIPTAPEAQ